MEACLQNHPVQDDIRHLYDLRYFYVDADIGQSTCGIALESMVLILRRHKLERFCGQEWYSTVERSSANPVVQGYLAEHICLCSIANNGLPAVDSNLRPLLHHTSFDSQPNWNLGQMTTLYIPTAYNFKAVDGVLFVHPTEKQAHMYPIQITISSRRKDSDEDFYQSMWLAWVEPLEEAG